MGTIDIYSQFLNHGRMVQQITGEKTRQINTVPISCHWYPEMSAVHKK